MEGDDMACTTVEWIPSAYFHIQLLETKIVQESIEKLKENTCSASTHLLR